MLPILLQGTFEEQHQELERNARKFHLARIVLRQRRAEQRKAAVPQPQHTTHPR